MSTPLLPSSEAALQPDVRAELHRVGSLVEALQPWAPLWLARLAYDGAALLDGAPAGAAALSELALALPGGDGVPRAARLYALQSTPVARRCALLLYIHGGGYALGSLSSHAPTCRALARALGAGWRVLALTYRRAPEAQYPAAAEDVLASYQHVLAHAHEFGLDEAQPRVAVAGDSAGGQLTIELALRLRDAARRRAAAAGGGGGGGDEDASTPLPALIAPIYPAINSFVDTPSKFRYASGYGILTLASVRRFAAGYLGATAEARARWERDALLNPDLQTDLSGLPPMLLLTAEMDPLHDEGVAFAAAARARGAAAVEHIEARGCLHGCVQALHVPSHRAALEDLAARIKAAVEAPAAAAAAAAGSKE